MGFMPENKKISAVPVIDTNQPGIKAKETAVIKQPDELLTDRKYVINTQNNATGVNTERLATVVTDLRGFAEGTPTLVTYYKEHYAETDVKGKAAYTEQELSDTHKSVLKIHGFEIKMAAALTYEHDAQENISKVTGEAFTYPGFKPEQGDSFVMEVDTGKWALMRINDIPVRMTVRAATYYKIAFNLVYWMSEQESTELEKAVVDEAWFDKQRFLNEPGALLYHDEYVELKFLKKERTRMINYYKMKFLDEKLMYSYMPPNDVYDPYVTDFMTKNLDLHESGCLASQLYELAPFLNDSVWRALMDEAIPLEGVPTASKTDKYTLGSKSVLVNSLINKKYFYWIKSTSLRDYFDAQIEYEKKFVAQIYPTDFVVTSTSYVPTADTYFHKDKTYYTKKTDGTYVVAVVEAGKTIPSTPVYYELKYTYGWKAATNYYTRVDGAFVLVDKTVVTVPLSTVTYYVRSDEDATTPVAQEGQVPANPNIPDLTTLDPSEDQKLIGDLMLHLHAPHYTECPLVEGGESAIAPTGYGVEYILRGTNEHIDLVRDFLLERKIDLRKLHACIENVWKLEPIQQFYKMPVYIFLARKAMNYVHYSEKIFER